MSDRFGFVWRFFVTGLCFATFSLGGTLLSPLIFLPLHLFPGGSTQRNRRAQALIQRFFAMLIGTLQTLGVMRLELHGADALRNCKGGLIFANHPSYLDVVIMLSLMPRCSCVVNSRLWRSPFYGAVVRSAGYIRNDAPDTLIEECASALDRGEPLIVFPEGTRSVPGAPLKLQRGAAHIALRSGHDILPVILECDPPTLTKGTPWYRIPPRPFTFRLRVLPSLKVSQHIDTSEPPGVAARKLTQFMEHFFMTELQRHANA